MLALQTPNLVNDIEGLIEHFDTSNYPGNLKKLCCWRALTNYFFPVFSADHPLYSKARANHLFLVKDEAQGEPITRFIGRFAVSFFPENVFTGSYFFQACDRSSMRLKSPARMGRASAKRSARALRRRRSRST